MTEGGFDPAGAITTGLADVTGILGTVAVPAIGLAASVLALTFGWRLVKRFVK